MPAFERKQIHHTLSKDEQIKTHSEGDEPYRYLVVEPVKKYLVRKRTLATLSGLNSCQRFFVK